jgi:alpha-mannosidase
MPLGDNHLPSCTSLLVLGHALLQALTGTSNNAVTADYEARLTAGLHSSAKVTAEAIASLGSAGAAVGSESSPNPVVLTPVCDGLGLMHDEDHCVSAPTHDGVAPGSVAALLTANHTAAVVVFNPLGWAREEVVEVMVPSKDCKVEDVHGAPLTTQFIKCEECAVEYRLLFALAIPPLGYTTAFITHTPQTNQPPVLNGAVSDGGVLEPYVMQSNDLEVRFNNVSGMIHYITNKRMGTTTKVEQQNLEYKSNATCWMGAFFSLMPRCQTTMLFFLSECSY